MKSVERFITAVFVLALVLSAPARGAAAEIDGVRIAKADALALLAALHTALRANDTTIPIAVSFKSTSEMPAYDKQWHYAGIREGRSGAKVMHVWFNTGLNDAEQQQAIFEAFSLAIADGGYAGPLFKRLYDIEAVKDSRLPAGAADPFVNRRKLAAALSKLERSGA